MVKKATHLVSLPRLQNHVSSKLTIINGTNAFFVVEESFGYRCSSKLPDPNNHAIYPISDSQAIVIWDKPMGYDYAYLITYRLAIEIRFIAMQDLQGFGTMDIAIIRGLRPSTDYHLQLQFYCGGNPLLRSNNIPKNFTTLPAGPVFVFFIKKLRLWGEVTRIKIKICRYLRYW